MTTSAHRRAAEIVKKASLLCGAVIVAISMGEVIVRLAMPQDLSGSWRVPCERRFLINKAGGTARHQCGKRIVSYRFNEHHLRGGPLGNLGQRVLCLGDSFTFGWLLEEPQTFVHRLDELSNHGALIKRYEFLNGGAGGWGTAHYLAFFEDTGRAIRPEWVVVFLNFEDIRRSMDAHLYELRSSNDFVLHPITTSVSGSSLKKFVDTLPGYQWCLEHSHLLQLVRRAGINLTQRKSSVDGKISMRSGTALTTGGARFGEALFLKLKESCRERDAKLLVIGIGFQKFVWSNYQNASNGGADGAFYSGAEQFFANNNIPFLDLFPGLHAACNGRLETIVIADDGHPNERGAALIADLSWAWLKDQMSTAAAIR